MKKKELSKVPVLYVPCRSKTGITPVLKKAIAKLSGYERIGLITTSQHLHLLGEASDYLAKEGKTPVPGGQILGCSVKNAKRIAKDVDAFLYIGSGMFHPGAYLREVEKPLFVANPYTCEVTVYSGDAFASWKKKQKARILRCVEARVFGVLVSTKTGQYNMRAALSVKKKLEASGRIVFLFAGTELSPDRLVGYKVDAWINTACPRIVDDYYDLPVVNPDEADMLLELI